MIKIVKVKTESSVSAVAGSLSNILKEQNYVDVQTIGAGALNQALKAIIVLRGYLTPLGEDIEIVAKKLRGITCGMKPTSCPDQLAKALKQIKEKENI